jgi:deoxyribodipyrimidine photo-lyase
MGSTQNFGIHWFRRDLRVAGNPGLIHNWTVNKGRVVGIFCFDSRFLGRADFSHNRFAFFLKTLRVLQNEMREIGGDLLVVDELPDQAFPRLFKTHAPKLLTFNRDYEPFARQRDEKILALMKSRGIAAETFRDHLLIEPDELYKSKPGDFYQIYSPFAKKWFDLLAKKPVQERVKAQEAGLKYLARPPKAPLFSLTWRDLKGAPFQDAHQEFEEKNNPHVDIEIPAAGSRVAFAALEDFSQKLKKYKTDRDIPSLPGTSRLSMYLKNGSISTAQIILYLRLHQKSSAPDDGAARFLKELVWREFYYHILSHRPDVETQSFLPKYRDIAWKNDKKMFQHWCDGTTGFPIVDAGMRQLNSTGWMHNRVRMIVASFLVKDLLINWQWGERYFMRKLLDGDLAPNNGGWQWAASTGCDPQPYFRIFNPWLQSEKFDRDGEYIKTYVPELRDVEATALHDPDGDRGPDYPRPIVDHDVQKKHAVVLYKNPE